VQLRQTMNIVLIGYRGTGKSTIGRALAAKLGRQLLSTDHEIIRRVGKSIADIVAAQGWEYFRDQEAAVCLDLAGRDNLIIDTGGGAILRQQNVAVLKRNGRLFWLTASVETIAARIGSDTHRPSLTGTKTHVDEIRDVLNERMPKYATAADYSIVTDGRSVEELVKHILQHLS
jgi:shikimate kinase